MKRKEFQNKQAQQGRDLRPCRKSWSQQKCTWEDKILIHKFIFLRRVLYLIIHLFDSAWLHRVSFLSA